MSQTYFISDTHFGHANLARLARTEFDDIVRHDMTIRKNWIDTVSKDDEVWMLGDFAYRCGYALKPVMRSLPGHKHLVLGNHDQSWIRQNPKALEQFESVQQMAEIDLNGLHLFLCHYPYGRVEHVPSRFDTDPRTHPQQHRPSVLAVDGQDADHDQSPTGVAPGFGESRTLID